MNLSCMARKSLSCAPMSHRPEMAMRCRMRFLLKKLVQNAFSRRNLVCVAMVFFFLCGQLSTSTLRWKLSDTQVREIEHIVNKLQHNDGFIYLLFTTKGYVNFTQSWMCNLQLSGFTATFRKTLFITESEETERLLLQINPALHVYSISSETLPILAPYGTLRYYHAALQRLQVQHAILRAGINVVCIESDSVWLSEIDKDVTEALEHHEMFSMPEYAKDDTNRSHPMIAAGFSGYRSTPFVLKVFGTYVKTYKNAVFKHRHMREDTILGHIGEQLILTNMLRSHDSYYPVHWLDRCEFASGRWYDEKDYQEDCPHPKAIQFNWVSGMSAKIERAVKWGHWYLYDNGTCAMPGVQGSQNGVAKSDQKN